jgi:membrane-associated phospholipid phosphatase
MQEKVVFRNEVNSQHEFLKLLGKYYYAAIGSLLLILAVINIYFHFIMVQYTGFILLASFVSFTARGNIRRDINIKSFLIFAVPYIAIIGLILGFGNDIWHHVLDWEMSRNITFNINKLFKSIPFNDAAFARIYRPAWLTAYMKVVYNTGFVLAVVVPFYRAALSIDFKKMLRYTLSAQIFQVFIFTPFYVIFYLQNVWFVYGDADPLSRHMTYVEAAKSTLNGLPSMHTSIAFAMFLLVLRERNTIFKWVWGFFCLSVIYSTMYLEVHWVIDVIVGLIFGYLVVKLVDFLLFKVSKMKLYKTSRIIQSVHATIGDN